MLLLLYMRIHQKKEVFLITLMSHRLTPINLTRLILILLVRFMYLKDM